MAPDGGDARDIKSAIEQVLPVRSRAHQDFIRARSAGCVGDVLSGAVDSQRAVQRADLGNSFEQGGLTGELMLQTLARNHPPGVRPRRFAQTFVHAQRRHAGQFAALVCRFQKFVLGGGVLTRGGRGRRVRLGGGLFAASVVERRCEFRAAGGVVSAAQGPGFTANIANETARARSMSVRLALRRGDRRSKVPLSISHASF